MILGNAKLEEILDVVLFRRILMDALLVIPDRTVDLGGTVEPRSPGAVLNVSLGAVPALAEVILQSRQR